MERTAYTTFDFYIHYRISFYGSVYDMAPGGGGWGMRQPTYHLLGLRDDMTIASQQGPQYDLHTLTT